MKTDDVIVGRVYEVRVRGRLVPVRLNTAGEESRYRFSRGGPGTYHRVRYFTGINLATGRALKLRASRLRREIPGQELVRRGIIDCGIID